MKVVGNCPSCGNPIWADGPEITKRTCFCVVPIRTQPITIQPQPYYPTPYPFYPSIPGGTWWCGDPNVTVSSTTNTMPVITSAPKPPDEDGSLVT